MKHTKQLVLSFYTMMALRFLFVDDSPLFSPVPLPRVKSPPWHMKSLITRWKAEPLKWRGLPDLPIPFSPVHRHRKFSAVRGTTSARSCNAKKKEQERKQGPVKDFMLYSSSRELPDRWLYDSGGTTTAAAMAPKRRPVSQALTDDVNIGEVNRMSLTSIPVEGHRGSSAFQAVVEDPK